MDRERDSDTDAVGGRVGGGIGGSSSMEYKTREKEVYAIVIAESLINHSREATKGGLGEYYEDAVDDTLSLIPSMELESKNLKPNGTLVKIMEFWRDKLDKAGFGAVDPVPSGEDRTYLGLLLWAENLHPSEFEVRIGDGENAKTVPISRTDPKAGLMNRARTIIKKRIVVDLLDDMRLLRSSMPIGTQNEAEFETEPMKKVMAEWAAKEKAPEKATEKAAKDVQVPEPQPTKKKERKRGQKEQTETKDGME